MRKTSQGPFCFTSYIIVFLMAITCVVGTCYAKNATQEYFIISSGSLGGNYNEAGNVLAGLLNDIYPERYAFKAITTEGGSIQNIEQLKRRFSDFAIVQQDVFIENYYGDGEKIKNVSIIAPLFQEKFIIYTHKDSHISFDEFREFINSSTTAVKVGLTSIEGTSYKTFSEIASLLGLNKDNIEFVVDNTKELLRKYSSEKIDYFLTFSMPIRGLERAHSVYFDDSDIHLLTNRMRNLSIALFDGNKNKTLGVWALFVGLNSSINQIGEDEITQHVISPKMVKYPVGRQIYNTFSEFKSSDTLFSQSLEGLPVIESFQKAIDHEVSRPYAYLTIAFSVIIIIFIMWAWWHSIHYRSHWKHRWIRYKHIFTGLLFLGVFYLVFFELLIFSEKNFFKENGIKSSVLDMTRPHLHLWNLIRIFANNDGGVFPISMWGKLTTILSTYVIWIGSMSIVVIEILMRKLIAKRRGGLMKIKYEKHIIIAGWGDSTATLIEELMVASKEYYRKKIMIVCVVPDPKSVLETCDYINDLEHRKELVLIKGYIRNKNILDQCNAHLAKTIILLAEGSDFHADEKTLMRALSIRKFCCKENRNKSDLSQPQVKGERLTTSSGVGLFKTKGETNPVYIIAEVNSEEFVTDLRDAGVNGIINRNKIVDGLLVQSILNPGVSKLINNILTISEDTNEFYTVDLLNPNNSHLRHRTFDELLLPLRKQNILLIAIKVIYRDQAGKEIVDEEEGFQLLSIEGLHRQIITNPITDAEINRRTDEDDQLITLAVSMDKLNAGLKLIKFDQKD